jgi:hypothetical protein
VPTERGRHIRQPLRPLTRRGQRAQAPARTVAPPITPENDASDSSDVELRIGGTGMDAFEQPRPADVDTPRGSDRHHQFPCRDQRINLRFDSREHDEECQLYSKTRFDS